MHLHGIVYKVKTLTMKTTDSRRCRQYTLLACAQAISTLMAMHVQRMSPTGRLSPPYKNLGELKPS